MRPPIPRCSFIRHAVLDLSRFLAGLLTVVAVLCAAQRVAAQPANALIALPRTGQTNSYFAGDDGAVRAGVAWPEPRFTNHADGTATDRLTGLMWPTNANLMASRDPSFDADSTARDGLVLWEHALAYVAKLNAENYLGHPDWRLPNLVELSSLIDFGRANPSLPAGHPFGALKTEYFSATSDHSLLQAAWTVNLQTGATDSKVKNPSANVIQYHVAAVLPVRTVTPGLLPRTGQRRSLKAQDDGASCIGALSPAPRFVDRGDGTVSDRLTGLMWTKNGQPAGTQSWTNALNAVAQMNTGARANFGHTDWRLPNVREAASLADYGQDNPALAPPYWFTNVASSVWTSTTAAGNTNQAWTLGVGKWALSAAIKAYEGTYAMAAWPVRMDATPLTGHRIRGRTLNANGTAVAGVKMTLAGPLNGWVWTERDGSFEFNYLPDGAYTLTAEREYYQFVPPPRSVTLSGADALDQNFTATLTQLYGWMDLSENLPGVANLRDVQFIGNQGWLAGGENMVFYTADGGKAGSFTVQTLPAGTGVSMSVCLRSQNEGYLVSNLGRILRSTNATQGEWRTIGTGGGLLYSVHFPPLPAQTGFACATAGTSGKVLSITGDQVASSMTMPGGVFYSICFPVSSGEGWLAGGTVVNHYKEGQWQDDQNYAGAVCYTALHFADDQHGWAVGVNEIIIRTTNGTDWVVLREKWGGDQYNDVFFLNPSEGWIAGEGVILHTTNGGNSWETVAANLTAGKSLMSVFAVNSTNVCVVGGNGVFLKYGSLLPEPAPALLAIAADKTLTLTGEAGQRYTVQTSPNLSEWSDWTSVTLASTNAPLNDPAAAQLPQRFYRARSP